MSNSRLEKFIYAICGMEVDDLPTPLSRIETLWNCLITGGTPDFEPLSRNEKYLMSMLTGDVDALPEPTSRSEKLLYKIATGETDLSDVPGYLSRYEELLKYLIENGGIGGTDFEYVLYTLNDSFSTLYSTAEDIVNTATIYGDTIVNTLQEPSDLAVTPIGENIDISNTTVNGTVEGKVKSAILKGQTLVNQSTTSELAFENVWQGKNIEGNALQSGKKYFVSFDLESDNSELTIQARNGNSFVYHIHKGFTKGKNVLSFILEQDANGLRFQVGNDFSVKISNIIILEYREGMENWDIPYFEGMQSVKMPVLTTTGKNLFDKNNVIMDYVIFNDGTLGASNGNGVTDFIKVLKGKTYVKNDVTSSLAVYDSSKTFIRRISSINTYTPSDEGYIRWNISAIRDVIDTLQIEESTQSTSYEPYKSNILSCNEEVTLRGIGEVKDTLDSTGELTQKIGEMKITDEMIDKFTIYGNFINNFNSIFSGLPERKIETFGTISPISMVSDKMMTKPWSGGTMAENVVYFSQYKSGDMRVYHSPDWTLDEFKEWFRENKPTIQYELATESIKTVDLSITDQDGNETSHLHVFNDTTHISTSAECLLPNVVIPADISYPSIIKANTLYTVKLKRPVTNGNLSINLGGTEQLVTSDCFIIQTPATLTSQNVIFSGKGNVISEVTVVEGDHTEKEYGYFEGIQSVKMPVLTTTGKNLFDMKQLIEPSKWTGIWSEKLNLTDFNLKHGETYFFNIPHRVRWFKDNAVIAEKQFEVSKAISIPLDFDDVIFDIYIPDMTQSVYEEKLKTAYIVQGSTSTTYEPYKTNILTTTSKNLFDMNRPYDNLTDNQATVVQDTNQITVSSSAESGIYVNANFILDKDFFAGKTVTGSCLYESDEKDIGTVQIAYQDGNGEYHYQWIKTPKTFTFPNSFIGDVMLSVSANNTGTPQSNTVTVKNIQLELGSTATPYEPYSEVTLRGIGEVKDTLDGNTGELTQRIGEIVLDGSDDEGWVKHSTSNTFYSAENTVLNSLTRVLCICDKMIAKQVPSNTWLLFGEVGVFKTKVGIGFNGALEELIIYLQQNPITVQYELETPIIKTVDLSIMDQDGQPTKLKTFNDITHVSIEAEDLLPTIDLEVATKIEETLSSLPTQMIDISETQRSLNEKINEQAENIKEVSTAITEIRNDIL